MVAIFTNRRFGVCLNKYMAIKLTGESLTIEDLVKVARNHERVVLDDGAVSKIGKASEFVQGLVDQNEVVYGITTGFGQFKNVTIDAKDTKVLQENLIRSHATGVGEPLDEEVVRALTLVRINSLIKGNSGIRLLVVESLINLLNNDIYPYIPEKGSVGSSGDLAPLSHLVLVIMGEGECIVEGKRVSADSVLKEKGLEPISLYAKEGLALNNGTSVQTGVGALAVFDANNLAKLFDISLAMSLESMMGSLKPYQSKVHKLRPHPGQIKVGENIEAICRNSEIIKSHKDCDRVQDSYSLRCAPQVHGASRNGIMHVYEVIEREINSVTDNPLLFPEDNDVISAGHFHGEPIAQVMDYLKINVSELANISERRIAKLVDPACSEGLPAFLIPKDQAGLSSGFMIMQYTAAALVSENKVLAHPASVDSIPTSANQEDHVSMGTIAARQAREILKNAYSVLCIEFLSAAQALDFRKPLSAGDGTMAAYEKIRDDISMVSKDRILYRDIEKIQSKLDDILETVEEKINLSL